jgi:hypothetical protein
MNVPDFDHRNIIIELISDLFLKLTFFLQGFNVSRRTIIAEDVLEGNIFSPFSALHSFFYGSALHS